MMMVMAAMFIFMMMVAMMMKGMKEIIQTEKVAISMLKCYVASVLMPHN